MLGNSAAGYTNTVVDGVNEHTRIHDGGRVHDGLGTCQCLAHEFGYLLFVAWPMITAHSMVVGAGATMSDHCRITCRLDVAPLGPSACQIAMGADEAAKVK